MTKYECNIGVQAKNKSFRCSKSIFKRTCLVLPVQLSIWMCGIFS